MITPQFAFNCRQRDAPQERHNGQLIAAKPSDAERMSGVCLLFHPAGCASDFVAAVFWANLEKCWKCHFS